MKLTTNFDLTEFKPTGAPITWVPSSQYQLFLLQTLANNLQIVRSAMPSGCTMTITDSVRLSNDFNRLISLGDHPSPTSDHYCGNVVTIDQTSPHYAQFGSTYFMSVGAADVIPNGMDLQSFFNLAITLTQNNQCKFGQIIIEQNPDSGQKWVHFATDYTAIFSDKMIAFLNRPHYEISNDGGLTYISYVPQ